MPDAPKLADLIAQAVAEANKIQDPEKARLVKRYLRLANESQ